MIRGHGRKAVLVSSPVSMPHLSLVRLLDSEHSAGAPTEAPQSQSHHMPTPSAASAAMLSILNILFLRRSSSSAA